MHEQMQGVKKQLQCLEDSCKKPTDKEQVAISENIMNLLLKLDTIQVSCFRVILFPRNSIGLFLFGILFLLAGLV